MPHECVDCGEVCEDGSSDVFEGCPSCGGTKFFYVREVTGETAEVAEETSEGEREAEPTSSSEGDGGQSTLEEIAEKPGPGSAADAGEGSTGGHDAVEIEADGAEHDSQQRARAVTVGDDALEGGWPETPEADGDAGADETEDDGEDGDDIVEAAGDYVRAFGGKLTGDDSDEIVDADAGPTSHTAGSGDGSTGETIVRDGKTYERVEGGEAKQQLAAEFETIKIVEPGSYELNLMNLYDRDEKIIALEEDGRYQVSLPTFEE